MKKTLLLSVICFSAIPFFAQPVITSADLLSVGDIIITQPCETTTFAPGSAGANQVWDFSQLIPEGAYDTTYYIVPEGTPYEADYPSSNIVGKFGSDSYGYYQITGDKLFFWGQADPTTALVLTNPATYFVSPVTFGTFVLDTIAGSLNAGPLSGSVTGEVFLEGDGYGTLMTPDATYSDVLRIKTTTVAIATVPFLGTIVDSVFNYSWYKLGIKSPVMEMIEDTQYAGATPIQQTRYINYFKEATSGYHLPIGSSRPNIQAYPNPAAQQVWFSDLTEPARLVMHNLAGQLVLEQNMLPGEPVSVKNLVSGIYICAVYTNNMPVQTIKLTIR